jgi:putative ATPase
MAFFDALSVVEKESTYDVPNHLKDPSRDGADLGHGQGYLYPHAYRDHWVAQQYLPDGLQGRVFYHPTTVGYEATIAAKVLQNREAQLAMAEERRDMESAATTSEERWIGRTFDGGAARAQAIRDEIFEAADIQKNSRVLDINATSGLISFEALRRAPEGGVFSVLLPSPAADNFKGLMNQKPEVERATIVETDDISASIFEKLGDLKFDRIVGRNFLHITPNLPEFLGAIRDHLDTGGRAVFGNLLAGEMPRIYSLGVKPIHETRISSDLFNAWKNAEDELLKSEQGQHFTIRELENAAAQAHIDIHIRKLELSGSLTITPSIFKHWFESNASEPSYIDKLGQYLSDESCRTIVQWAATYLRSQTVPWPTSVILASF